MQNIDTLCVIDIVEYILSYYEKKRNKSQRVYHTRISKYVDSEP